MPRIELSGVSKFYAKQSREFFWRVLLEALGGKKPAAHQALRDCSLKLSTGDALGIVGHNGAGKTTLLNLVAGLTVPEEGAVQVEGRVAAMMELGSGFHPDLTGLENLRINAAIQGLSKGETESLTPAIIEFSEIGEFIAEPLRTYSQGMILRLAFSVSVHANPDILLIDELLAVGDQDFQEKCFAKLEEMKREGKILVCVSHFPEVLGRICNLGLWLDHGRTVRLGPVKAVLEAYQRSGSARLAPR